jgi:hypothetical protein
MKQKRTIPLLLVFLVIFSSLSCQQIFMDNKSTESEYTGRSIGINLFSSQLDYCEDRFFADAMKTARLWRETGSYGNGDVLDDTYLDDDGWPTCDASIIMWAGIENMNGTYYLEGECESEPTLTTYYAGADVSNWDYSDGVFSAELAFSTTTTYGLSLQFSDTDTDTDTGGVRNVKLMKPTSPGSEEYYSTEDIFTDTAKELVDSFDVVRFMWAIDCWNGPWQEAWEDRVDPDYCSFNRDYDFSYSYVGWAGCGMAWEYAIKFCNETGKDAWINMPIGADEDYIESLAQLWYDEYTVDDGVIYWEYSNEATWDGSKCSSYMSSMATDTTADYYDIITYDDSTNESILKNRYYAMRSVEMSEIWRDVWGDDNMMTRIRPVHSGQLSYDIQALAGLSFIHNYYSNGEGDYVDDPHPVDYYFYGAGGSHYTGDDPDSDDEDDDDGYTEIEVFEKYEEKEACLAKMYGLERVAYEGGIWTDSEDYELARITTAMVEYHELWEKYDGDLLMYYVTTGGEDDGTALGFTTDAFDLDTRKYEGVDELLSSPKDSITAGKVAPCSIEGADWSVSNYPGIYPQANGEETTGSAELSNGNYEYRGYLFRVEEEGDYDISITCDESTSTILEFMVDGDTLGEETIVGTESSLYTVTLSEGLHAIRLKNMNTSYFNLNTIEITTTD